jgi:hypothetical protein
MKTALKRKKDEFLVMPLKHVLNIMGLVNHPGTPKLWAIDHENGHKRKNDEFLAMSLKHVLSVMGLINNPRTPKLWASMAHENGPKTQNDEFLVMPLKHVLLSWTSSKPQNCGQ